ncbi:malate dehydrogenase [Candidatus Saccharibacteria bacterium RIFCSPHIGHO2_12_FULL_49_19]|nr:MAG: malate dehydrogenase [Candidatus Saccharibacteria bacterium RIFCSPHIGHO2_01_FULL_49_21]OGL36912.1 MAG: malate dehydrogenase [Candidatus Saccharibacteria bacterium RIFCSPHIGHO2_12_FULL_49_19]OGL38111.1 MAG: malate dehydrogenase [Candidatus Saccharibacteria bacterium RIFCSPLOWO2_01_FULL_49_22]
MDFGKKALASHKRLRGKIGVSLKDSLDSQESLSIYYTPGVAAVSKYTARYPDKARDYTWLNNSVAVVSDGSAVLGLGDIGPYGALPVMEGKAMLFKHFAGIDAVPIVLDVHQPDEIIEAVKAIAPSFGGINLEDIAAPQCFEIEEKLKKSLPIPVFHDDQHGTAVVVLAGLINAMKVSGRKLSDAKIVVAGAGAAGTAIIKLLHLYAKPRIFAVDSRGIISANRDDLNNEKKKLLEFTNLSGVDGSLEYILAEGADVFIGVSKAGLLTQDMVKSMDKDPIIFAMANPDPEILPDEAKAAGAAIVATGRSDFPNQVNNALAFPGIFRGALDNKVRSITDQHKIAAAQAIASLVKKPASDKIIPSVLDKRLVPAIARVIR